MGGEAGTPVRDEESLPVEILCVVGPRALDSSIVGAAGLPFERLDVGGIHGMAPWLAATNLLRFILALPRAAAIIGRFKPQVVLVGGGYVCAPVAAAAWLLRVPVVTLCVDVVPGWAVRFSARLSRGVAVAFPQALRRLPGATLTGYPVRGEFLRVERRAARQRIGLADGEKLLLAFGGSLGARAINEAVIAALPRLLSAAHVMHVRGGTDGALATDHDLPAELLDRYHPYAYLDGAAMADALAAADLVVCRAGASAMAELPVTGTPAILVPGPFSAQEDNARAMMQHGAAEMILDRDLTPDRLAAQALALLADQERLARMAAATRALAPGDAAEAVATLLREIVERA